MQLNVPLQNQNSVVNGWANQTIWTDSRLNRLRISACNIALESVDKEYIKPLNFIASAIKCTWVAEGIWLADDRYIRAYIVWIIDEESKIISRSSSFISRGL